MRPSASPPRPGLRRPRVLLVGPTAWDEAEIARCRIEERYEIIRYARYDTDHPGAVDISGLIDDAARRYRGVLDGVVGTHDYPGSLVAAAIAEWLGLPGPGVAPLLCAQNKISARALQQAALPDAVPRWYAVSPSGWGAPPLPAFFRPAKSVTSRLAERIDDAAALTDYLARAAEHFDGFTAPFDALWQMAGMPGEGASQLLAEEIVEGVQTTVEGFVQGGRIEILGVVDSVMFEGTQSFKRFDHPSSLPTAVRTRMVEGTRALVRAHGFDHTLFNVEWFWMPESDRVLVIEVNPRMSYQFADLFEKRDGVNTYELQMCISTGRPAHFSPGAGPFEVACSVVLRLEDDKRIVRHPGPAEVAAVLEDYPDARVHLFGAPGMRLSELPQDAWRFRYGCINIGGADTDDAERRAYAVLDRLGVELE